MRGKEQFDAIVALIQFRAERRDKRIALEWKVSLGVWALLAGAIVYPKEFPPGLLLACWLGALLVHGWWVWTNFCASERDSDNFYPLLSRAAHMAFPTLYEIEPIREKRKRDRFGDFLRHGPVIFQLLTTGLLGAGMYLVPREAPAATYDIRLCVKSNGKVLSEQAVAVSQRTAVP